MKSHLKLLSLICAAAVSTVVLSACSHDDSTRETAQPAPAPAVAPAPMPAPASQPGS